MLLAIDVGNSQTDIGIFGTKKAPIYTWRVATVVNQTADEKASLLAQLLGLRDLSLSDVSSVVLCSVVPSVQTAFVEMSQFNLGIKPLVVDHNIATGLDISYPKPDEIGADRIANVVGALEKYRAPLIVVDFGTATTFDVIIEENCYLGGVIAPGLEVSAKALFASAAKLSPVELKDPQMIIGKDTGSSVQSGLINGFVSMVDGMVEKISSSLSIRSTVIATGGLVSIVGDLCQMIEKSEPFLTLLGLRKLYQNNLDKL
jgi:type III pantothenate kinase